jgi:dipeptidyl aminopeptidase/acylaminoacyl peptidase
MRDVMKEIWYDVDDPKELQRARDVSPLLQIDRIQKPVFVVQGANDPRVKLSEANQMVQALRRKGLFTPYMVKENEGHGFYHEENRIEFYKAMIGFLKSYL